MKVIETNSLTKRYHTGMRKGPIMALDGVTINVEPGQIFGLLGPNGAGKTTFVKILLNITRKTSGDVLVNGLPPSDTRSREKIGFLPENHRFPPYLTGRQLLELAGQLYGLGKSEIEDRITDLLNMVGMESRADSKIRTYSKGMMQRIGLAQAMIADPDLLLLDEPTDGVDPVGRVEIKNILLKIRGQGKTILLNSHQLSEVERIADSVMILSQGKVVKEGTVESFTTKGLRYEIEAKIGNERFEIPERLGKLVSLTTKNMVVDLKDQAGVNDLIDEIRLRRIPIYAVKPLRITLEEFFIDVIRAGEEKQEVTR